MTFVGLENYRVILKDPYIVQSLTNTLEFAAILLPTGIFIAIVFAVILNNKTLKGRGTFRTLYFLPYVTNSVIIAIVFTQLFDDQMGWINQGSGSNWASTPVRWLRATSVGGQDGGDYADPLGGIGYNILLFPGGVAEHRARDL
jgi:lactose/L-arabinose transport system permease protein